MARTCHHQARTCGKQTIERQYNETSWINSLILLTCTPSAPKMRSPDITSPPSNVTSAFSGLIDETLLDKRSLAGCPLPSFPIAFSRSAVCKCALWTRCHGYSPDQYSTIFSRTRTSLTCCQIAFAFFRSVPNNFLPERPSYCASTLISFPPTSSR